MSDRGWGAIEAMIGKLKQMAEAPRSEWLKLSHQAEALAVVKLGSPAPIELQLTAAAAKGVARQMPHSAQINETEFRGVAQALAAILKNGMDLAISQMDDSARPYHLRGER